MDFMSDREFQPIFHRFSRTVSLKGCISTNDINQRITKKINRFKKEPKEKTAKKGARYNISQLRKLQRRGIARRIINEAIVEPDGYVALTLRYGRKKAEEIRLAQARKRLGPLRRRR